MKNFLLLNICILCSWLYAAPSHAAFWYVDDLSSGSVNLSSSGTLQSSTEQDLEGVIEGERYAYVQRTSAAGSVSVGVNVFPFPGYAVHSSLPNSIGVGGLHYGRNTDLNADYDRNGMIFGFRLSEFSADEPAWTGTIRLTLYDGNNTEQIGKSISTFQHNPEWLHSEFNSINFANITRIDLDWYGFTANGADLAFNSFNTLNWLPEPSTTSMLMVAAALIFLLRRSRNSTWISAR